MDRNCSKRAGIEPDKEAQGAKRKETEGGYDDKGNPHKIPSGGGDEGMHEDDTGR